MAMGDGVMHTNPKPQPGTIIASTSLTLRVSVGRWAAAKGEYTYAAPSSGVSKKPAKRLLRSGLWSFRIARASIWRMRSRVTP